MSGVVSKVKAFRARRVEAKAVDKKHKEDVKAFKAKFNVNIDKTDWSQFHGGMLRGLTELEKWVDRIVALHGARAQEADDERNDIKQVVSDARQAFKGDPEGVGKQIRDDILPALLDLIDEYRVEAKNTPVTKQVGNRAVAVFWTDIPGYEELSQQQADAIVSALAQKVARGMDAYDNIAQGGLLPDSISPAEATDFIWAMKSKAQEKGGAYAKGALTIPNGERARQYLDLCEEVYPRASSHLKEQQRRPGQSARGVDFYKGAEKLTDTPPVVDGMLPFGMNTVLYQQLTGTTGDKLLYIKFETEGAPGTGKGNKDTDPTAPKGPKPPDGRKERMALSLKNTGKTIKHGGNFVKSKIKKDEPDKDLKSTREQMPKAMTKLCESIVKDLPKSPEKAALAGALKVGFLNGFLDLLNHMVDSTTLTFPDGWTDKIDQLVTMCVDLFTDVTDMDNRFGGEVVLTDADM